MYEEQVRWATEEGAEFIIAETLQLVWHAELAFVFSIRLIVFPNVADISSDERVSFFCDLSCKPHSLTIQFFVLIEPTNILHMLLITVVAKRLDDI